LPCVLVARNRIAIVGVKKPLCPAIIGQFGIAAVPIGQYVSYLRLFHLRLLTGF
jgi:hypothetical protein